MTIIKIANKYIEPGGYMPGERKVRSADDILTVSCFIGWHEDGDLMGGYRAKEAFAAFCRLMNFPQHELRKIVRGD